MHLILLVLVACSLATADEHAIVWWSANDGVLSRDASETAVPLSKTFVWYLLGDTVVARSRLLKPYAAPPLTAAPLAGLNTTLSVITTGGVGAPDVAWLLLNRRIFAFEADSLLNRTRILYRSSFQCNGDPHQVMSINLKASLLVARCASTLAVMNLTTGARLRTIPERPTDTRLPVPLLPNSVVTHAGSKLKSWPTTTHSSNSSNSSSSGCPCPDWDLSLSANITSVVANEGGLIAVTVHNSSTCYFISSDGELLSNFSATAPNNTLVAGSLLPRPTFVGHILYLVLVGSTGAPPQPGWSLLALNLSRPHAPQLVFSGAVQPGAPRPQPLAFSARYVFVSLQEGEVSYNAYNRDNGTYAWTNNWIYPWSSSWTTPGLASTPHCCDEIWVASNVGNSTAGIILSYLLLVNGLPVVDPDLCSCKGSTTV